MATHHTISCTNTNTCQRLVKRRSERCDTVDATDPRRDRDRGTAAVVAALAAAVASASGTAVAPGLGLMSPPTTGASNTPSPPLTLADCTLSRCDAATAATAEPASASLASRSDATTTSSGDDKPLAPLLRSPRDMQSVAKKCVRWSARRSLP